MPAQQTKTGRAHTGLLIQYLPLTDLKDPFTDALIAATAWKKNLEIVTTNPRHFRPIAEIRVRTFPDAFGG